MRTIAKDYYTGFEGEPEYTFVRKDGRGSELAFRVWDGHFGRIMDTIQPGPQGWTGLALPYHLVEGWYDDPDWRVPDADEAAAQLDALDRAQLPTKEQQILDELVAFIREGISAGDRLYIQYD